MKTLFDKTELAGIPMRSRLVRSATGENLATPEGHIPEDLMTIYRELAEGGVGMIILSFTSVAPIDHFNDGLLRLCDDKLISEYAQLTNEIHSRGCSVIPQLALGIYQKKDENGLYKQIPVDYMKQEDVEEVIHKFVSAAERAKKAGFDGIQLHGCHGFVLGRFLNSRTNHRKDTYGGSIQGRTKILTEIIHGIRDKVGDIPIAIKLSAGELPADELISIISLLEAAGLNFIEYEGYFSEVIPVLLNTVKIPVILTGGHRELDTIDLLLNQFDVDYIGMSRPLIREPDLLNRWESGIIRPADCISCGRCMTTYGYRCSQIPNQFGKPPRKNR